MRCPALPLLPSLLFALAANERGKVTRSGGLAVPSLQVPNLAYGGYRGGWISRQEG